jgi:flagellar biogenesis protein FliO
MLGGLLLVVALILGLGKLVKRLQATRGLGGKGPVMQLRGGIPLGGRERAVWMQAGDTHLLLGVSPGRVQMLHVFDVPPDFITTAATEAPAAVPANARSAALAVAPQAFSDRLKTLLAHAKAKGLDIETAAMETGMAEVATAAQVAPQAAPKVAVAKAAKPNFSFHA